MEITPRWTEETHVTGHKWALVVLVAGVPAGESATAGWPYYEAERGRLSTASNNNNHREVVRLAGALLPKVEARYAKMSTHWYWVQSTLGRSLHFLGESDKALPYLKQAANQLLNQESSAQIIWANLYLGSLYNDRGEYALARESLNRAERAAMDSRNLTEQVRAELARCRGNVHLANGEFRKAMGWYAEQNRALKSWLGTRNTGSVYGEENIALCEIHLGEFSSARRRAEWVVSVFTAAHGRDDPKTLIKRIRLARYFVYEQEPDKGLAALTDIEAALKERDRQRARFSDQKRKQASALADSGVFSQLGYEYSFIARPEARLRAAKKAHALAVEGRAPLADLHDRLAELGYSLDETENLEDSVRTFSKALTLAENLPESDAKVKAARLSNALLGLAEAESGLGRYARADEHYRESIRIARETFGAVSKETAYAEVTYSSFLKNAGKLQLAEEYAERARIVRKKVLPNDLSLRAQEWYAEACDLLEAGDKAGAKRKFTRASDLLHTVDRCGLHRAMSKFAQRVDKAGDVAWAAEITERELNYALRVHGPQNWVTMDARLSLSVLLRKLGRFDEAREQISLATEFFENGDSFSLCKL